MTVAESKLSYTPAMLRAEDRLGRPLRIAIQEAYQRCGTMQGTADILGVKRSSLTNWMLRLHLTFRRTLASDPPGGNGAPEIPD